MNLINDLKNNRKFVLIASDPTDYEKNDLFLEMDIIALNLSGISFNDYVVLDNRNKNNIAEIISEGDLIFLCGGNTFIQNKFFNDINLKHYLKDFKSTIVGISAGSINAAKAVFNSPECEEDLKKSPYLNGLELTFINIEPHFVLDDISDEKRKLQRDSIIQESYKRIIYGLTDGAYIYEKDGKSIIYGESYKIQDGEIIKICDSNESCELF